MVTNVRFESRFNGANTVRFLKRRHRVFGAAKRDLERLWADELVCCLRLVFCEAASQSHC